MIKSGKISYLEPEIFALAGISCQGFTTRNGGVSRPPYNSLNLGSSTLDAPHNAQGNRNMLARACGVRAEQLVTVTQTHGSDLLVIDTPNSDFTHFLKLECDGIVTNQPGVMIGVCVADCVPLLLLDPVQRVAAALHAGCKGTAERIAGKGIEALVAIFGCKPADILAAIGPAIGACCYEVDAPVMEAFRKGGSDWDSFARETGPAKWALDLALANRHQLLEGGVSEANIDTAGVCVSCNHDFFSYRRDQGDTGRQMGFIMLKQG